MDISFRHHVELAGPSYLRFHGASKVISRMQFLQEGGVLTCLFAVSSACGRTTKWLEQGMTIIWLTSATCFLRAVATRVTALRGFTTSGTNARNKNLAPRHGWFWILQASCSTEARNKRGIWFQKHLTEAREFYVLNDGHFQSTAPYVPFNLSVDSSLIESGLKQSACIDSQHVDFAALHDYRIFKWVII